MVLDLIRDNISITSWSIDYEFLCFTRENTVQEFIHQIVYI